MDPQEGTAVVYAGPATPEVMHPPRGPVYTEVTRPHSLPTFAWGTEQWCSEGRREKAGPLALGPPHTHTPRPRAGQHCSPALWVGTGFAQ